MLYNLFQKYVSCMGRGVPMDHDNKIVRPSSSYMINRTRLNFDGLNQSCSSTSSHFKNKINEGSQEIKNFFELLGPLTENLLF